MKSLGLEMLELNYGVVCWQSTRTLLQLFNVIEIFNVIFIDVDNINDINDMNISAIADEVLTRDTNELTLRT